jgi:hypothetical protein
MLKEKKCVMFRVLNTNLGFESRKENNGEKRQKLRKTDDALAHKSTALLYTLVLLFKKKKNCKAQQHEC